jgi:riboflavin biosynthesis pyrimidine reductase
MPRSPVIPVPPVERYFDRSRGRPLPLPGRLSKIFGPIRFPAPGPDPWVIGNFASTLDGVVALQGSGHTGGGEITGSNPHDRLLMGILRAAADAVIVGAGTLRAVPHHRWTAPHIYAAAAPEYAELRRRLRKPPNPTNVIVTASGALDLRLPVFSSPQIPVLIVTTSVGARRLSAGRSRPWIRVVAARRRGPVSARAILKAVGAPGRPHLLLVEGGPHLIGAFFEEERLDELFLTLAPQVAGREDASRRPGLVEGRTFAPDHPLWGSLTGVRRGGSYLFLRFAFPRGKPTRDR